VAGQRRRLEEARVRAETAEKEAGEFAAVRPAEESALFAGIQGRVLPRQSLDLYHAEIAALKEKERKLFEMAETARNEARKAEKDLERALQAYREAAKGADKFKEHRSIWQQEENRRLETKQEQEAEENAGSTALYGKSP
jgi:hypothetical protein